MVDWKVFSTSTMSHATSNDNLSNSLPNWTSTNLKQVRRENNHHVETHNNTNSTILTERSNLHKDTILECMRLASLTTPNSTSINQELTTTSCCNQLHKTYTTFSNQDVTNKRVDIQLVHSSGTQVNLSNNPNKYCNSNSTFGVASKNSASTSASPKGTKRPNKTSTSDYVLHQPISNQNNNQLAKQNSHKREASDQDDDESSSDDNDFTFNHESILTKILNEKKLALSRSPEVLRFFSSSDSR